MSATPNPQNYQVELIPLVMRQHWNLGKPDRVTRIELARIAAEAS